MTFISYWLTFKEASFQQIGIGNNWGWFVDIELMMRISLIRNNLVNIWEVPLNYWKDVEGSKISFTKFPQIIFEIFRIRLLVKKTLKSLSKFN